MSSEKGNVARRRPQRHQNVRAFKNDKYDTSARLKKINAKLHDGVCQHCKDILEWRVKFSKYKLLSKPKKCVKCLQKAVKDPYHIICRPCASKLGVCAKCGKEKEIVIPIDKEQDGTENKTTENGQESGLEDELDFDTNFSSTDNEEDSDRLEDRFKSMNFERTEIQKNKEKKKQKILHLEASKYAVGMGCIAEQRGKTFRCAAANIPL
uniref:Chromosome 9 open reading frame 85 n=1 Tax=Coturnix japonica TaxID=93934 RepID=A0A8C2T7S9_COTJA